MSIKFAIVVAAVLTLAYVSYLNEWITIKTSFNWEFHTSEIE